MYYSTGWVRERTPSLSSSLLFFLTLSLSSFLFFVPLFFLILSAIGWGIPSFPLFPFHKFSRPLSGRGEGGGEPPSGRIPRLWFLKPSLLNQHIMIIQTDLNGTLSAWMTKDVFCKYFSFFMFWFISVCCSWVRQSPNCFSVFLPLWWAAVAKRIIPSINKDTRHPVGQTKGWRESPDQPDLG